MNLPCPQRQGQCSRPGCFKRETGFSLPPLCERHELAAADAYALEVEARQPVAQ